MLIIQSEMFTYFCQIGSLDLLATARRNSEWEFAFLHKSEVTPSYTVKRPAEVLQEAADIIEVSLRRTSTNAGD